MSGCLRGGNQEKRGFAPDVAVLPAAPVLAMLRKQAQKVHWKRCFLERAGAHALDKGDPPIERRLKEVADQLAAGGDAFLQHLTMVASRPFHARGGLELRHQLL